MKICTSISYLTDRIGYEQTIKLLSEAGFDGLDFGMFNFQPNHEIFTSYNDDEFRKYFEDIGRCARANGVEIFQVHAPMPSGVESIPLDCAEKCIKAASFMGSRYIVIHPIMPRGCIHGRNNDHAVKTNMDYFKALIPTFKEYGVTLGIENMFGYDPELKKLVPTVCSSVEEMIFYIDELNNAAGEKLFAACLDTGHAAISGTGMSDMARHLGNRLEILHVHDNNAVSDMHTAPGLGILNFKDFAQTLSDIEYKGMFSFECDGFFGKFGENLYFECAELLCKIGHEIVDNVL